MSILMSNTLFKNFSAKYLMLLLTELFRVFILRFESSWPNLLNYDKSDLKEKIKAFLDLISIVVKLMVIFYIASFFYRMVENSVNMDSEYSSLTYG